jgi:hypothetical protein
MREYHWTWDELQATPAYVRRFCWDLYAIRNRVAAERRSDG